MRVRASTPPTDAQTSRRLSRQARRDTAAELAVRRELHRRGLRFRVEYPVPGLPRRRIDVAFTRRRVVVFVDGCFWHACPAHGTSPKNNGAWWDSKLRRNVERDRETGEALREAGWKVLRVWEHEDPSIAADRIAALVTSLT